eukprot:12233267-Alexandrium_andersonii.AAC.1
MGASTCPSRAAAGALEPILPRRPAGTSALDTECWSALDAVHTLQFRLLAAVPACLSGPIPLPRHLA